MATYKIGDGVTADYATFTLAEAAIDAGADPLPEVGGTTYEVTGTVAEDKTFLTSDYSSGLILTALAGEEADGTTGGAYFNGKCSLQGTTAVVSNLNIKEMFLEEMFGGTIDDCDIGNGTTIDAVMFKSTSAFIMTNCIIRDGNDDCCYGSGVAAGVYFSKCSAVDGARIGFLRANVSDSIAYGNTGLADFHSSITGDYLASSDTSAQTFATNYFNSIASSNFNNYAGGDFNLAAGSSLNTAGTGGGRIGALLNVSLDSTISADFISSTTALYEPLLILDQTLSVDYISTGNSLYEPSVVNSGYLPADFISSGNVLSEPALYRSEIANATYNASWYRDPTYGANWWPLASAPPTVMTLDYISSGNSLYDPTVIPGAISISVDYISSGHAIYEPDLNISDIAGISFISSTVAMYEPSVAVVTDQSLPLDFISSGSELFTPTVVSEADIKSIDGDSSLSILTNYQSKTLYCSPDSGWFTID